MQRVKDIRDQFVKKLGNEDFVIDKSGVKTIEIIGSSFIADEDHIIRKPNDEYIKREIEWYESKSLFVKDIPGTTPKIWEAVSDVEGKINSNYGWCIWTKENYNQYHNTICELKHNPNSRRAVMIYNRPKMWNDYNRNGMSDFICTYANTFLIRDNKLISHYLMRSNDAVFGYNNDYAWAKHVQKKLLEDLKPTYPNLELGDLIWTATSLHVYEKHFEYLKIRLNVYKVNSFMYN